MPSTFWLILRGELAGAGLVEEVDAEPHQMVEQPALVARDEIVADLAPAARPARRSPGRAW